jgi:hypothetical protein
MLMVGSLVVYHLQFISLDPDITLGTTNRLGIRHS